MRNGTVLALVLAGWLAIALVVGTSAFLDRHRSPSRPQESNHWLQHEGRPSDRDPPKLHLTPKERFVERQRKLPRLEGCEKIDLNDPVAEANHNAARGDYRPFTVEGFTAARPPQGIFCPKDDFSAIVGRGGTFVSDMPDACGATSFSVANPEKMKAYNRALASRTDFQRLTGCRPSTLCEERYGQSLGASGPLVRLDPQCPTEPSVFVSIAGYRSPGELAVAMRQYRGRGALGRDLLTRAAAAAAGEANWSNMKSLIAAGADINGRLLAPKFPGRGAQPSPLEKVFDQSRDMPGRLPAARWLLAHGANAKVSGIDEMLGGAAASNDTIAVEFLLALGASANGGIPPEEADRLAHEDIRSAGSLNYGYGRSPLYSAIFSGLQERGDGSPRETAWADRERQKAEHIAVRLYIAGGRFIPGEADEFLYRNPNLHVASIMIAAADREGRRQEYLDRLLENIEGREKLASGQKRLVAYLRAVKACRKPVTRSAPDHVRLCRSRLV